MPRTKKIKLQTHCLHLCGAAFAVLCGVIALTGLMGGCDGPSFVRGQPRSSSKKVLLANREALAMKVSTDSSGQMLRRQDRNLDFSFLHKDHFAVALIDVVKILANPDLESFNWDRFTKLLRPYVGYSNAHPQKLSAVWVLCDAQITDSDKAQQAKESDFVVFVVEFLEPFDDRGLADVVRRRKALAEQKPDDPWRSEVRMRSDRQVVIGTAAMLDKLETADQSGEVAQAILTADSQADIVLSVSFEPVRGALRGVMAMATQFLGDEIKPLLQFPTSARLFNATLSFSSDRLLQTRMQMSSSDSAQQVTEVWSKLLDSGNIGQLLTFFSFQFGAQKGMFKLNSLPVLNRISRQIEASSLYQVFHQGPVIKSQFTRPRDFGSFLGVAVDDVERSLSLINRLKRMRQLAGALKSYEEVNGVLPSPDYFHRGAEALNRSLAYSWRAE